MCRMRENEGKLLVILSFLSKFKASLPNQVVRFGLKGEGYILEIYLLFVFM